MPFSTCSCCENRYGLDDADLVMVHKGIMGVGKHTNGHPVETRVTLTSAMARELIYDLMCRFDITKACLRDVVNR